MKSPFYFVPAFSMTLLLLISSPIMAQSFVNGDLNGTVSVPGQLPASWQSVPDTDPVCQASSPPEATPDLTDLNGPYAAVGINGSPHSGLTFMTGLRMYAPNSNQEFQEGIMQTILGFQTSVEYRVSFWQSVVKQNNALDESGSWAVYVDTSLVGIVAPTNSSATFNNTALTWEPRAVYFFASATSHTIKFLPMDDDSNIDQSNTDITGALRMGIDSINIIKTEFVALDPSQSENSMRVYPNPIDQGSVPGQLGLVFPQHCHEVQVQIMDVAGRLVRESHFSSIETVQMDIGELPGGVYTVLARSEQHQWQQKIVVR